MFKKNIPKKINNILLTVLILNLAIGNLFFMPKQAEACLDPNTGEITTTHCYSCDTSVTQCVKDPDGPYWCPIKCNNECSGPTSSGPIDVTIVGPTPSCTPVNPADFFGTISSIYDGTEMANNTINEIINIIQNDKNIPENLKLYVISSIQNFDGTPEDIKNLLIDIIENNEKIPEDSKSLFVSIIQDAKNIQPAIKNKLIDIIQQDEKIDEDSKQLIIGAISGNADIKGFVQKKLIDIINKDGKIPDFLKPFLINAVNGNLDISGLIRSWILDLLLKNISVEHICKSLSDVAANMMVFGTSVGTPIAMFITQMCPIILNEILEKFLQTIPSPPPPPNTQSISYPIFESYQWEVGIPGFFKPGEITPFK